MSKNDNLIPQAHVLTLEEQSAGGRASQKVQAEKRSFKKAIEWLLNSDIKITQGSIYESFKEKGIDISNMSIEQQMTLGVALGGIQGNASNYKTLMEGNNEIEGEQSVIAPTLRVELVDNTNLEKTMYETDKH